MKKGIIVLLITVLAAGMAFAGLTGSAAINLGYNLDTKDYGFANVQGMKYSFTFEVDTTSVDKSEHQTNVWAEVGASAKAIISVKNAADKTVVPSLAISELKITKANIHVNDFTFGILNAGGAYDYAADYHLDDNGDPILDKVASEGEKAPGFTVSYNGYSAGFGFNGNVDAKTYNVLVHAQTKSFEFAEGVSAQAAAYAFVSNAAKNFYFAAKGAYAADKLSADAAAEVAINDSKVNVEAAANASYDFVYANVYMYALDGQKAYLDARIGAGYTFAGDVHSVKVNGFVDAENVIVDAREITVGADATATLNAVEVYGKASYAIFAKGLNLEGKVSYKHDIFTAYAQLKAALAIGADPALTSLVPEVGVKSSSIVENAELALVWKGAEFAGTAKKNGAVTASATIKF